VQSALRRPVEQQIRGIWYELYGLVSLQKVPVRLRIVPFPCCACVWRKLEGEGSLQLSRNDGAVPAGGIAFDKNGNLYGATTDGGSVSICQNSWCGTVYQLSPGQKGWTETMLHVFQGYAQGDGGAPAGGVILDGDGNVYGTTAYGGTGNCNLLGSVVGCGTVYQMSPPTGGGNWTETVIYSFQGGNDGYAPGGDLVFDKAGNLYGATLYGGGGGSNSCDAFYEYCGTIFEVSPPKKKGGQWTEQVLYSFQNQGDGALPNGGLILDKNGVVYGTTYCGGSASCSNLNGGNGTVFRLQPPKVEGRPWTFKVLYSFKGDPDGGYPAAGLAFGNGGRLYGTTQFGGNCQSHLGTVFELIPPVKRGGAWKETLLYSFTGGNDGREPKTSVVFDNKGNLDSTASGGGLYGNGTVFQLKPKAIQPDWTFDVLYTFNYSKGDGFIPTAGLVLRQAGSLYSATQGGGNGRGCRGGCGTVFEISP
jgi:hypothetical protein